MHPSINGRPSTSSYDGRSYHLPQQYQETRNGNKIGRKLSIARESKPYLHSPLQPMQPVLMQPIQRSSSPGHFSLNGNSPTPSHFLSGLEHCEAEILPENNAGNSGLESCILTEEQIAQMTDSEKLSNLIRTNQIIIKCFLDAGFLQATQNQNDYEDLEKEKIVKQMEKIFPIDSEQTLLSFDHSLKTTPSFRKKVMVYLSMFNDSNGPRKLVFNILAATLHPDLAVKFCFTKKVKNSKKMIFSGYEFVKVIEEVVGTDDGSTTSDIHIAMSDWFNVPKKRPERRSTDCMPQTFTIEDDDDDLIASLSKIK